MRRCRRCSCVVVDDALCPPQCRTEHKLFRLNSKPVHGLFQYRCRECRRTWNGDEHEVTDSDLGFCRLVPHVFSDDEEDGDEEEEEEEEDEEDEEDDDSGEEE